MPAADATQPLPTGRRTEPTISRVAPDGTPWKHEGARVGDEIVGPDGGTFVWVPAGSFMMGSEDGEDDEKPVHQVELDGFWLGKHEVTNARYRAFCEATQRQFPSKSDQGDDHPVVYVSWDDAHGYCEHYGYSLPTEAQWEYAAAGPEGRKYPWGNDWDPEKLCWSKKVGPVKKSFVVGSFPAGASWCGALDMAGNVQEWCGDWFGENYYERSPDRNPLGPDTGTERVLRGLSWYHGYSVPMDDFRCANRSRYVSPVKRSDLGGFRCAISIR